MYLTSKVVQVLGSKLLLMGKNVI